ncbi:fumarylacetoacetase [Gordonia desulfuricans]|uniref:fumarylacetoacetase n=1 Tax=Gordonia desulfuricans TaxID=89051 RepID=A0A7K3LUU9_9ACTN|nr:fumarylacetoacetase [Gordonia desulfuricans]NDK92070.1 fumarylacetoacetase [Gordonia desulfuricans]
MSDTTSDSFVSRHGTDGFGIAHLPYGSFSTSSADARLGVRVGDHVLALTDLVSRDSDLFALVDHRNLDALLASDRSSWDRVRADLQSVLSSADHAERLTAAAHPVAETRMHMPFTVADYVDFYGNEFHAANVGRIFRPEQAPLLPNWKHLPVGYHGRAGTIAVSGTDVRRPHGLRPEADGNPSYGPSRRLDIEAEMGFVLGSPVPGGRVSLSEADDHVFGLTLTNDWSARDIQAYEYVPLGPNLGKSFITSISPWVTPLAALEAVRVAPPVRDTPLAEYLDDAKERPWSFDVTFEVVLNGKVVANPPFASTYWTAAQMLAHMTVNGAGLRAGDFFAGGTISGPEKSQRGSFLELAWGGAEPIVLDDGSEFTFLRDGDEVTLRATAAAADGSTIRFGECTGRVIEFA